MWDPPNENTGKILLLWNKILLPSQVRRQQLWVSFLGYNQSLFGLCIWMWKMCSSPGGSPCLDLLCKTGLFRFAWCWWLPGVAPAPWWFLMANTVIIMLLIRDLVLNNWALSPDSLLKQIRRGRSRHWESSGVGHFHKSLAAITSF